MFVCFQLVVKTFENFVAELQMSVVYIYPFAFIFVCSV